MRALLVDTTHPILEDGLASLGYTLDRCYGVSLDDLPLSTATGLVLRGRIAVDSALLDRAPPAQVDCPIRKRNGTHRLRRRLGPRNRLPVSP